MAGGGAKPGGGSMPGGGPAGGCIASTAGAAVGPAAVVTTPPS